MNIRLYNARILTMKDNEEIFLGEIHVKNDKISYIGSGEDSTESNFDREIDCERNLLMPGFKNAHTHSGMSFLRSIADDLPLDKWLNEIIFPYEAKLTENDIYELSKLSVLEYLSSGITACFDMYLTPDSIARSMEDMGFRCVQTGAMNNFSQSIEIIEKSYIEINRDYKLQSYIPGFHAEYTTSYENMKAISELALKYESPIFCHLGETKAEVEGCIERYNKTPLKLLDDLGMFNFGGGIYHGIYMTDEDLEIMKKRKLYEITCPGSNLKLASGIAPIKKYLDNGICVAIGTDGPASNNCLDMFREMFLVSGLSKYLNKDASSMDAGEILKMATVNGALCMNLKDCDVLDVSKKADIIMIDLKRPNMQPINNIVKNLVYSGSKENIKMTMINGNILYENGCFLTNETAESIYDKTEEIKKRIVG